MAANVGTTIVSAPVSPPDSTSNFGGSDTKYQVGGYQEWFANEGDWTDLAILPAGRKRVGMWVRSLSMTSSKKWYQLDSTGPDVWTAIDVSTFPTAAATVTVVSTMADLDVIATTVAAPDLPGSIFVRGYSTPGIGAGMWRYDATSDYPVNNAVRSVTAGGRYMPVFTDNNVDITKFGHISYTSNNTAMQQAFLMSQDTSQQDNTLFIPSGDFGYTATLAQRVEGTGANYLVNNGLGYGIGATTIEVDGGTGTILAGDNITFAASGYPTNGLPVYLVRIGTSGPGPIEIYGGLKSNVSDNAAIIVKQTSLVIKGIARTGTYDNQQYFLRGSTLRMLTNNTRMLRIMNDEGCIQDLNFAYNTIQNSGQTEAIAISNVSQQSVYRWMFNRLSFRGAARSLDFRITGSGPTMPNCTWNDIYIMDGSIQPVYFGMAGTTNAFNRFYVQNNGFVSDSSRSISNIVKSGLQLTLTCVTAIPTNLTVGSFMDITGAQTGVNGAYFCRAISGLDVICDMTADPGLITDITGTLTTRVPTFSVYPLMYIGAGCDWAANALDVEVTRAPAVVDQAILIENHGNGSIDTLHMEFAQPGANNQSLVMNTGSLTIQDVSIVNIGTNPTQTLYAFHNTYDSWSNGSLHVGNVAIRDISTAGSFILARNNSASTPVRIDSYMLMPTQRANAQSNWPVGNATSALKVYQNLRPNSLQSLTAASGTETACEFKQTIEQSGTAAYNIWLWTPTITTQGSGSRCIWNVAPNGVSLLRFKDGCEFTVGTEIGVGDSHVRIIGGESAVNVGMRITAQSIQTFDATTVSLDRTLSLNIGASNSNVVIGNGANTTRIGPSTSTPVSAILFGTATLVPTGGGSTVNIPWVPTKTTTIIALSYRGAVGGTQGFLRSVVNAGVSFDIFSSSATDSSDVSYIAFNP